MRNFWRILSFSTLVFMSNYALAINPFSLPWVNHPQRDSFYAMKDHPDGVFVLEFLANYCATCNANAVNVNDLALSFAAKKRVQVLDISIDRNDREIAAWIRKHQPNHPVLKDLDRKVWNEVSERYIPTVLVVDCHGSEHYRHTGAWNPEVVEALKTTINNLLAQECYR